MTDFGFNKRKITLTLRPLPAYRERGTGVRAATGRTSFSQTVLFIKPPSREGTKKTSSCLRGFVVNSF